MPYSQYFSPGQGVEVSSGILHQVMREAPTPETIFCGQRTYFGPSENNPARTILGIEIPRLMQGLTPQIQDPIRTKPWRKQRLGLVFGVDGPRSG